MATFSKIPLSGSTNGKGVQVSATSTVGDAIHTAVSGTSSFDEVWIYAVNISASSVKLTIEYGGTEVQNNIEISIPGESGLVLVIPGLFLNNAQVVRAFAATTNVITLHGYVNRVS
jgi:hypothetical protein